MICCCVRALRSMTSTAMAKVFSSSRPERNMCDQPRMAVRGVRSSCESVARNSSFRRFDSSAAARARTSNSSSRMFSMATAARFAAIRIAVTCSSR